MVQEEAPELGPESGPQPDETKSDWPQQEGEGDSHYLARMYDFGQDRFIELQSARERLHEEIIQAKGSASRRLLNEHNQKITEVDKLQQTLKEQEKKLTEGGWVFNDHHRPVCAVKAIEKKRGDKTESHLQVIEVLDTRTEDAGIIMGKIYPPYLASIPRELHWPLQTRFGKHFFQDNPQNKAPTYQERQTREEQQERQTERAAREAARRARQLERSGPKAGRGKRQQKGKK